MLARLWYVIIVRHTIEQTKKSNERRRGSRSRRRHRHRLANWQLDEMESGI